MKTPKSRDDWDNVMMLLDGELRDATGKHFGFGKNPETAYLPENTPIEDKAYAALSRELSAAAKVFEVEIEALMAELEKIPGWPLPTPTELDAEVSRLIQLKLLLENLAGLSDPHSGTVRRIRVGFRSNDARTDFGQIVFVGARVRRYEDEERARKPRGATTRAVNRVADETGLSTRRIYAIRKVSDGIWAAAGEPRDKR